MVRTKASATGVRVSAAKAPRKYSTPTASSSQSVSSPASKKATSARNTACAQPVPDWQKPISSFFTSVPKQAEEPEQHKDTTNENANEILEPVECDDENKENQNPQDGSCNLDSSGSSGQNAEQAKSSNQNSDQLSASEEAGPSVSPNKSNKPLASDSEDEDEPGPSHSRVLNKSKLKRRRVVIEDEEEEEEHDCIADIADEITTES